MRHFDLSPLMKSSVGFDHLNRLLDPARTAEAAPTYPPYNIEKLSEDDYKISMAVAGFGPDELNVTVEDNTLTISADTGEVASEGNFLHRGIAKRAFERKFDLADTIKVGAADYRNGLLEITLRRVIPDHKKPRSIEINTIKGDNDSSKLTVDAA